MENNTPVTGGLCSHRQRAKRTKVGTVNDHFWTCQECYCIVGPPTFSINPKPTVQRSPVAHFGGSHGNTPMAKGTPTPRQIATPKSERPPTYPRNKSSQRRPAQLKHGPSPSPKLPAPSPTKRKFDSSTVFSSIGSATTSTSPMLGSGVVNASSPAQLDVVDPTNLSLQKARPFTKPACNLADNPNDSTSAGIALGSSQGFAQSPPPGAVLPLTHQQNDGGIFRNTTNRQSADSSSSRTNQWDSQPANIATHNAGHEVGSATASLLNSAVGASDAAHQFTLESQPVGNAGASHSAFSSVSSRNVLGFSLPSPAASVGGATFTGTNSQPPFPSRSADSASSRTNHWDSQPTSIATHNAGHEVGSATASLLNSAVGASDAVHQFTLESQPVGNVAQSRTLDSAQQLSRTQNHGVESLLSSSRTTDNQDVNGGRQGVVSASQIDSSADEGRIANDDGHPPAIAQDDDNDNNDGTIETNDDGLNVGSCAIPHWKYVMGIVVVLLAMVVDAGRRSWENQSRTRNKWPIASHASIGRTMTLKLDDTVAEDGTAADAIIDNDSVLDEVSAVYGDIKGATNDNYTAVEITVTIETKDEPFVIWPSADPPDDILLAFDDSSGYATDGPDFGVAASTLQVVSEYTTTSLEQEYGATEPSEPTNNGSSIVAASGLYADSVVAIPMSTCAGNDTTVAFVDSVATVNASRNSSTPEFVVDAKVVTTSIPSGDKSTPRVAIGTRIVPWISCVAVRGDYPGLSCEDVSVFGGEHGLNASLHRRKGMISLSRIPTTNATIDLIVGNDNDATNSTRSGTPVRSTKAECLANKTSVPCSETADVFVKNVTASSSGIAAQHVPRAQPTDGDAHSFELSQSSNVSFTMTSLVAFSNASEIESNSSISTEIHDAGTVVEAAETISGPASDLVSVDSEGSNIQSNAPDGVPPADTDKDSAPATVDAAATGKEPLVDVAAGKLEGKSALGIVPDPTTTGQEDKEDLKSSVTTKAPVASVTDPVLQVAETPVGPSFDHSRMVLREDAILIFLVFAFACFLVVILVALVAQRPAGDAAAPVANNAAAIAVAPPTGPGPASAQVAAAAVPAPASVVQAPLPNAAAAAAPPAANNNSALAPPAANNNSALAPPTNNNTGAVASTTHNTTASASARQVTNNAVAPAPPVQHWAAGLGPLPTFVDEFEWFDRWKAAITRVNAQYANNPPSNEEIATADAKHRSGPGGKFKDWKLKRERKTLYKPQFKPEFKETAHLAAAELGDCSSKEEAIVKIWRITQDVQQQHIAIGRGGAVPKGDKWVGFVRITCTNAWSKGFCGLPNKKHVCGVHYRMRQRLDGMTVGEKDALSADDVTAMIEEVEVHVADEYAALASALAGA